MEAQSNHVIEATYYLTTLTKWGMIFEGSFGGNVFGQILDDMSWRRTIFLVFHVCFFVLILQFGTPHSNLNILHAEILYMVTLLIVSEWIFHVLVSLRSRIVKGTSREPVFITIEKKSYFFFKRFAAWKFKAQQSGVAPLLRLKDWYMIDDLRQMNLMLDMFLDVYQYWCLLGYTQKGIGCECWYVFVDILFQ